MLNLLRAGDSDAAAELLIDYVEQAWMRVRDAARTLEDLALLDIRKIDVVARREATTEEGTTEPRRELPPPELSPHWSAAHARWCAEALRHAGRFDEARESAQKARKIFFNLGDETAEAHTLRLLAHILSEQGAQAEAHKLVSRALTVFDRHDDDAGRASCEVVLGEIDYLVGNHVAARDALHRGARRFQKVGDALGRAQCLLLLGMIALAEGVMVKSRDLLVAARAEFDGIGYRLGCCQCDIALSHVDHRAGEFEAARARALKTRDALAVLQNPRANGAVERVLAMVALDASSTSDVETGGWGPNEAAVRHAQAALELFKRLGDPWGITEAKLLLAQEALVRGAVAEAEPLVAKCEELAVSEPEPMQHRALTRAWLHVARGEIDLAMIALGEARRAFSDPRRNGDHTPMLLQRFVAMGWPEPIAAAVREWVDSLGASRSVAVAAMPPRDDEAS
ncbi:MAG: tetratricopeptide repeat protein [Polyangiales bacterium]